MGLRINNNIRALFAARSLSTSVGRIEGNYRNLASGHRVNRVSDNAASYFISVGMNAQSKVIGQVVRNITDGVSLAQTADSALHEASLKIYEIRDLATESALSPLDNEARFARQVTADALLDDVDYIGATTRYGGMSLLSGQVSSLRLQSGSRVGDDITVRVRPLNSFRLGQHVREDGFEVDPTIPIDEGGMAINEIVIRQTLSADDGRSTIFSDGSAIAKAQAINDSTRFTGVTADIYPTEVFGLFPLGGTLDDLNRIAINGNVIKGFEVLEGDADRRLRNEINARSEATGVRASLEDGNIRLTAEDGRNIEVETTSFQSGSATGLNDGFAGVEIFAGALLLKSREAFELEFLLPDMDFATGFGDGMGRFSYAPNETHALGSIDITTPTEAKRSLEIIDVALSDVGETRSDLGSVLSQLQSALKANEGRLIHLEVSRHRIQDTEFASELTRFARNTIVQEAGSSILAQANFGAQSALSLLRQAQYSPVSAGDGLGFTGSGYTRRLGPDRGGLSTFGRDSSSFSFGSRSRLFGDDND
jgi:flagellin